MDSIQTDSTSDCSSPAKPKPKANNRKKVIFTAEEEELIIEHYQQNEFLWNPKHDHYKFGWKSTAVQDLAIVLGNKFTPTEIHSRFSAMRTTYRQNAAKVINSTITGSSADDVYVPTWQHYESLKFLDVIEPTRTATTSYTVQRNDNSMYTDFETLEDTTSKGKPPSTNSSKGKKAREEEVMEECLGVLRTVVSSNDKNNDENVQPKDRCQHFGNFVASSLREMAPWYQSCAMTEVSNTLLRYDKNNPDRDNETDT